MCVQSTLLQVLVEPIAPEHISAPELLFLRPNFTASVNNLSEAGRKMREDGETSQRKQ